MKFVLFFISLIFSFIFFIFYRLTKWDLVFFDYVKITRNLDSISWNLIFETIFFLFLGIFLFVYFSNTKPKIISNISENPKLKVKLSLLDFSVFLKKYFYYVWFLFFYISVFLIIKSLNIGNFEYFILFWNIIILGLFFLTHKFFILRDFIKINTIIFSIYYTYIYLSYFISGGDLSIINNINWFFVLLLFLVNFWKNKLHKSDADNSLLVYFFVYSFVLISFYLKIIFTEMFFNFFIVSFFLNIISYFYLQKVQIFYNSKYTLRWISVIFSYISIIFWIINLLTDSYLLIVYFILSYLIVFNYKIHYNFQNYISLSFFSLTSLILFYYSIFSYLEANIIFLILSFLLSFSIIISSYLIKYKYIFDNYFFHIISYSLTFFSSFYYFFFINRNFSFLLLWIVLFMISILIFISFIRLKKISK